MNFFEQPQIETKPVDLTKEKLALMQTLETEIEADFSVVMNGLRARTGADLQSRPDGYHLTIIGPTESKILVDLNEQLLSELQTINEQIKHSQGVVIKGVGFIDGANPALRMRAVDRVKKTAFISVEIPALQEFRAKVGLPPKDFHVTLGFVGGDIHFQVVGQKPVKPGSPEMKDITAPIPKKADPNFSDIELPAITFGALNGQLKKK